MKAKDIQKAGVPAGPLVKLAITRPGTIAWTALVRHRPWLPMVARLGGISEEAVMAFDIAAHNAGVAKAQSFVPGTREWSLRLDQEWHDNKHKYYPTTLPSLRSIDPVSSLSCSHSEREDYDTLHQKWRNTSSPTDRDVFARLLSVATQDQVYRLWKRNNSPWDELAFEKILATGDYDLLSGIWRKSSSPWDRRAFDRFLPLASSDQLMKIWRKSSSPWDQDAKDELQRRGAWRS